MLNIVLIALFSLVGLLILHELSHFGAAKKLGLEVEEFGVGYPPRLLAKKIGKTIYSFNLLPFGAFVRMPDSSLRKKAAWQRALVIMAGIVSFWLFSAILLIIVMMMGAPVQIEDEEKNFFDPRVQILGVASGSPAEEIGLKPGDVIRKVESPGFPIQKIDKVKEVQEFIQNHKGQEVILTIKRGKETLFLKAIPRVSYSQDEGALGIILARVGTKKYSAKEALIQGPLETIRMTGLIVVSLGQALYNLFLRKPSGIQLVGPVGIMNIFVQSGSLGLSYFLQTMAMISLHLAIFNALPFPVADGGKLSFLALEKIRKKPLNEKTEEKINTVFFGLMLLLMVLVTIKDIAKLF